MKFKSEQIQQVWDVLQGAKAFKRKWDQRKLHPIVKGYGLCHNLDMYLLSVSIRLLINKRYPLYSGNSLFPIPHPEYGRSPTVAYHSLTVDKYDRRTEYGRNRYEYLLTIISTLEDIINNHNGERSNAK